MRKLNEKEIQAIKEAREYLWVLKTNVPKNYIDTPEAALDYIRNIVLRYPKNLSHRDRVAMVTVLLHSVFTDWGPILPSPSSCVTSYKHVERALKRKEGKFVFNGCRYKPEYIICDANCGEFEFDIYRGIPKEACETYPEEVLPDLPNEYA